MSLEQHTHDDELATLLQSALRAETPPGLSDAQRSALMAASGAQVARPKIWKRVVLLAVACALPCALYVGVVVPQAREEARLRAAQEEQAARAEQLAVEAEQAAHAAQLAVEAEQAKQLADQEKMRAEASRVAERAAAACAADESRSLSGTSSKRARPAASKPSKLSEQPAKARASGGGCDPNDPLCGL